MLLKKQILLPFIFILSSFGSLKGQSNFSFLVSSGATRSNIGKGIPILENFSYEINPVYKFYLSVELQYSHNKKLNSYFNIGNIGVGYEERRTNGFYESTNLPLHIYDKITLRYYEISLGCYYFINKKTRLLIGTSYLHPVHIIRTFEEFHLGLLPVNFGFTNHYRKESGIYQFKQTSDIGFKIGLQHEFWNRLGFGINFYQGLIPIDQPDFLKKEKNQLNQAFTVLLNYRIPKIKKKTIMKR